MKTYYTAVDYCELGDNIYLSDISGDIDYIPGAYQMAIGIIFSGTEILLPYQTGRTIERRGFNSQAGSKSGENSGSSCAICTPRNARMAIVEHNLNIQATRGECMLINPIKMSGSSAALTTSWSGNYVTLSWTQDNNEGAHLYITFLT